MLATVIAVIEATYPKLAVGLDYYPDIQPGLPQIDSISALRDAQKLRCTGFRIYVA